MKCPNGCAELVEIKKPCFLPIDTDQFPIHSWEWEKVKDKVTVAYLIRRVCPECGFYECQELTQPEIDAYLAKESKEASE